jgi:RNA polymerase sigma factor (TIGR02999 family)
MMSAPADVTDLLRQATSGEPAAADRLFAAVYDELRELARRRLRGNRRNELLDTTALVHESYLRFSTAGALAPTDRAHFLGYASRVMRSVIVDFARRKSADRRGGGALHVTLHGASDLAADEETVLQINEALEALAKLDPRMAQVVEMRYFGGLSELEIAEALGVTDRTVRRDWEKARLWLAEALT